MLLCLIDIKAAPFIVKSLGLEKGLSSNFVIDMTFDKYGYLWVATDDGLNRFDGSKFHSYYKNSNGRGLSGNELSVIADDPKLPILWVGTMREGLNAYDYKSNRFYSYKHERGHKNSICANEITSMQFSKTGKLWLSTSVNGIDCFDRKSKTFTHYNKSNVKHLVSNNVWAILDNGKGLLYVGHINDGFSVIDVKHRTAKNYSHISVVPNSLCSNTVLALCKDRRGRIWLGTNNGVDMFDPQTKSFTHIGRQFLDGKRVFVIRELSNGSIYAGIEQGGMAIINPNGITSTGDCHMSFISDGIFNMNLSGNSVKCIVEDGYKNIWAGIYGGGVNFITKTLPTFRRLNYSALKSEYSLSDKTITALASDSEGNLWIGTDEHGIDVFSRQMKRTSIFPTQAGKSIQTLVLAHNKDMIIGSFYDGLFIYDHNTHQIRRCRAFPIGSAVWTIHEYKNGYFMIGTTNGIYIIEIKTGKCLKYINLDNNFVRTITHDRYGNFWIGTFDSGVIIMSPSFKIIRRLYVGNGLPSNSIKDIAPMKNGNIFIATNEGLILMKDFRQRVPRCYNLNDGLENIMIGALTEDKSGNVWMCTDRGISCLTKMGRIINFGEKDNLPPCNFISGCVTSYNGYIFFGLAGGGVVYFNPREVFKKEHKPVARINSLTVYSDKYENTRNTINLSASNEIMLKYDQNSFSVNFNVSNYALADMVEYSYKIEGINDKWCTINDNDLTLRNLSPGSYRLYVRARLHNQQWSTKITTLDIVVSPPLWMTWWARLLYLVIASHVAYLIFKTYSRHLKLEYNYKVERKNRKQQEELNEERLRFFTNITHELRTPLTLITAPLDDMSHSKSLPEKTRRRLKVIHKSALHLTNLINQMLEFRKVECESKVICVAYENIVDLLRDECVKFDELNQNKNVSIVLDTPDNNFYFYFDRDILTTVIDNLMTNAMKYTNEGYIKLSVCRGMGNENNLIYISVTDTGYGMSAEALPHVFENYYQEMGPHQASGTGIGLALVKRLVELHQGNITVTSTVDKGSTFSVSLNYDYAYPNAKHKKYDGLYAEPLVDEKEQVESYNANIDKTAQVQRKLLVVDDNLDICNYISEQLSDEFVVFIAGNGLQGLDIAQSEMPNIIVSDIMMPVMDGNQMCRKLKSDMRTSNIPIH
jgi:signal transduction histidine kinase/ligand-binding sensor domain-containing protein